MNRTIRDLLLLCPRGGFKVTDVPQSEGDALIWLYKHANGPSWTDHTNWLQTHTVGDWFGVTVAGGHVTQLDIDANNGSGDIAGFDPSALPSLAKLYLNSNSFTGDLSGWTLPASLTYLYLNSNSFTGDLSGWTLPASLVRLYLNSNSFTGDLSGWTLPASLTQLYLATNSFTGDLSGWTLPASLTKLYLNANSFTGDLGGWTLPASLTHLYLYGNSFTGDLSGWTLPASLTHLYLYGNSFTGTPNIASNTAMRNYQYQDNALVQADVDAVLLSVYNRRAAFTYATPELNVGGTNLEPGGIYQDGDPPTTGKEYIYELCNDPETEGFNTWTITYTAGNQVTKP